MGSTNRHSRALLAAVVTVCCTIGLGLVTGTPVAADPRDDADQAGRRTARAEAILENATDRARAAAVKLEQATAALPAAQRRVATSRGLVAAARATANTARRTADAARARYATVAAQFAHSEQRLAESRRRVDDIASASYMGATFGAINMLVGATGPADAMDRLDLVDQLMQKQQDAVAQNTADRRAARIAQDESGLAKRTAEEAERAALDKLTAARTAQHAAEQAQIAVITLTNARRQALAAANSQRAAVLARYQQAKAEEARIEAALRGWSNKGGVLTGMSSGGTLLMPVHGWKSSDFGERYDPYYRVWQLHAGADFASGEGTPIHAAADGRVIQAGWNGGYGNYTCIGHGRFRGASFSTCYGHQSAILVHVGEYVRRGEVIGRVGTTGASTGDHLHFETRFNGVPRNPLPYLPSCLC